MFSFPAFDELTTKEDAVAFWRAGRMALGGEAALAYDAAAFREGLAPPNDSLLWLNPPHFFLVTAPLGLLPYPAAKAAIVAASLAALLLTVRIANPRPLFFIAILLSPAAYVSALVMQTGPLVAAGLVGGLVIARQRPILSGLLLALLTMKPQYGLMAPVFLAAIGAWRAFAAAGVLSLALAALSALLFGAETWAAFFTSATDGALSAHGAKLHRDMVTLHQTIGKIGAGETVRLGGQVAAILLCAGAVFSAARRWPRAQAIGFALLASAFASPSLWVYDWPLVAAGLIMLARGLAWPWRLQLLASALWIAPLISPGFMTMESSLVAPAIFAAALIGFWTWTERQAALKARPETP